MKCSYTMRCYGLGDHGHQLVTNIDLQLHWGTMAKLRHCHHRSLPGAVCYDLNYYKASLPLKTLCAGFGQRYIDGLGMLVEQAAKSFYIWTGKQPESDAVIEKCRSGDPVDHE